MRPYNDDADGDGVADTPAPSHSKLNVGTVTNGFGKGISTNDMYEDMNDMTSDFYNYFMTSLDSSSNRITQYRFVGGITDPLAVDDGTNPSEEYISSLVYPYPYFGNFLPNDDIIDKTDPNEDLNFIWPVAKLEEFEAEFVYYEVYGNKNVVTESKVGVYQTNSSGMVEKNTLIDTDVDSEYRILTDGYAIKVNRPYSMLEDEDITFKVNGVEIDESDISSWLNTYTENTGHDKFTDNFRIDSTSDEIESVITIDNATFQQAVNSTTYADTTDVMQLQISSGNSSVNTVYINPLFAKAIYYVDATDAASMQYSVRSARHLNNIGYFANSESVNSKFIQEVDIDLSNYNEIISKVVADWSYSINNPIIIYNCLIFNTDTYSAWANLHSGGASVASINVPFSGIYDADGHTIENLTASGTSSNVALFNAVDAEGDIKNLTLANFDITSQGLAIGATLVAQNAGDLINVSVENSTVLATFSTYTPPGTTTIGTNRPTNVGGVVAENSGTLNNVSITNSSITRHEVTSETTYSLRSHGAGGLVGSNSGTISNSGATNTTITAYDNFIGGLVGVALGTESVVENSYFVHNGEDATSGEPITPISYDSTAGLVGPNPRYSIGGIVGGIVHNEYVSNVLINDEATVKDTLYLAVAPTMDTNSDGNQDTSYPLVGTLSSGFTTVDNNVYLSGTYYSNNNSSWTDLDYNILQTHLPSTASATALAGLPSENITTAWLAMFGNGQLSTWQTHTTSVYPTPSGIEEFTNAPYAANRPKQHTSFIAGNGTAADALGNYSATLKFNSEFTNFTTPGNNVNVSLQITNTSATESFTLSELTTLEIALGDYANYIDVSQFEIAPPDTSPVAVIDVLDSTNTIIAQANYTYNTTNRAIEIDTTSLTNTLTSGDNVTFSFNINVPNSFDDGTFTGVSTYYYYILMQADIGLTKGTDVHTAALTSDKLYIQPQTTITSTVNGGSEVANTGAQVQIPVNTAINTSNVAGYTQKGAFTQVIPNGFDITETSLALKVDNVTVASPLISGTHYTITSSDNETPTNPSDDTTILTILNIAPTNSVQLDYELTYTGAGGVFNINTTYNSVALNGTVTVAGSSFENIGKITIATLPAPAPAPFSLLPSAAQLPQESTSELQEEADESSNSTGEQTSGSNSSSTNDTSTDNENNTGSTNDENSEDIQGGTGEESGDGTGIEGESPNTNDTNNAANNAGDVINKDDEEQPTDDTDSKGDLDNEQGA